MDGQETVEMDAVAISQQKSADLRFQLNASKIHPVLLFGTASSGKSALLQSMVYYGEYGKDAGFRVSRGADVFPPDYPHSSLRNNLAKQFYLGNIIDGRREGLYPQHTQALHQFFIPVDLAPSAGLSRRFAFLEGNGELFNRRPAQTPGGVPEYAALTPLVEDLIRHYDQPLSLILVAPYHVEMAGGARGNVVGREESCICLERAIAQYFTLRAPGLQHRDNICLLVSKWDLKCRREEGHNTQRRISFPGLLDISHPDMVDVIRPWVNLWNTFSLQPNFRGGRALMPYSSGVDIDGTIVLDHPAQPDFDFMNRTLWNWLYGNATAKYSPAAIPVRDVLCPDTVTPRVCKQTWVETLGAMLLRAKRLVETG